MGQLEQGYTTVSLASTVTDVARAEIVDDELCFYAGPDSVWARYVDREVKLSDKPEDGYKSAGKVLWRGVLKNVLVQMPKW